MEAGRCTDGETQTLREIILQWGFPQYFLSTFTGETLMVGLFGERERLSSSGIQ